MRTRVATAVWRLAPRAARPGRSVPYPRGRPGREVVVHDVPFAHALPPNLGVPRFGASLQLNRYGQPANDLRCRKYW